MTVRYDKLWSLTKNNKMKKSDLAVAELSQYTMTKLNQDRIVSMEVMLKLCKFFIATLGT